MKTLIKYSHIEDIKHCMDKQVSTNFMALFFGNKVERSFNTQQAKTYNLGHFVELMLEEGFD